MKHALLVPLIFIIGCNSGPGDTGSGGGSASSGGGGTSTAAGGGSASTGGGTAGAGGGTSPSTGGGAASTGGGTSSSTGGGGAASTGGGTSGSTGGGTASAGGGSASTGGGSACTPPTFATAVPAANAVELIVTRNVYAAGFQKLADLHTALGTPAAVLTLETLCTMRTCTDSDVKNDTIKALKDELISRTGLKYVLLGGAFDTVPARVVSDSYTDPLVTSYTYAATYPSDYYYSDFSEWDTNHDGVYADPMTDTPAYLPSVAVSRLPVRSTAEVDLYVSKVLHHLTAHGTTGAHHALLISNIAAVVEGIPIDSALYFTEPGRTLALLPANEDVDKLYATSTVDLNAQLSTPANELAGLDAAPDIVVHSGHAGGDDLMTEQDGTNAFTSSDAQSLTNPDYPFFFSCGCEAGDSSTPGNAGEALINAPTGGAISYLGNVPVGLGIAGGMQLIDETLRYVQSTTDAVLGDAYFAGHQNLPKTDSFTLPVIGIPVPVVDANSWRWTQKGVMLYGDLALPMWSTSRPLAPTVTATRTDVCEGAALSFTLSAPFTGTLRVAADGKLYSVTLTAASSATLDVQSAAHHLEVGLAAATTQFGYQTFDL